MKHYKTKHDAYLVSEDWEEVWSKKTYDFYKVHENNFQCRCFHPVPPPPDSKGYIYLPGSGGGYWLDREEAYRAKLIHDYQYKYALEDARE